MDELLQSLVRLIDAGGELADDALYLYFALQFAKLLAVGLPFGAALLVIYKSIVFCRTHPSDKLRLKALEVAQSGFYYDHEGCRWKMTDEQMERLGFTKVKRDDQ
ncbi:MAG: hypothetical protein VW405_07360 [Rhodospirillaceae bacterium]